MNEAVFVFIFEKRWPPRGLIVGCVFVRDKTSLRAHISMFHRFIYYVNSSTEYFSNWLGHEPLLPIPIPVLLLHVSLFAQRQRFGQLVWGGITFWLPLNNFYF